MSKTVWILTNPENGWDCIVSVHSSEKSAEEAAKEYSDELIIHEEKVYE